MPAVPFQSDLDAIITHAGLAVVCGTSTTVGILRRQDVLEPVAGGDQIQRRATTLLIRSGTIAAADLVEDAACTVNGVAYTVRWFDVLADGSLTKILLAAA